MLGLRHATFRTGRLLLSGHGHLLLLAVILVLSGYTHLWNPAGFPPWHVDETAYTERALDAMNYDILHDRYDHPFLGWTILAGFMYATGYPDSFVTLEDVSSLDMLYGGPRILMGLLAILDTFLIYKIAERGFGRRAAPIAAVLFAVMPVSLTLRHVLLDSILLPFVLSSVLLAMYARCPPQATARDLEVQGRILPPKGLFKWNLCLKSETDSRARSVTIPREGAAAAADPDKTCLLILLSGVCMGCAILVKIPSLVMIPLVLFLVYSAGRMRQKRRMLLWLAPVILVAAVWPASAVLEGQSDQWINDVLWHTERIDQRRLDLLQQYIPIDLVRSQDSEMLTRPAIALMAAISLFEMDPVLVSLGTAGLVFAVVTRSRFLMLWTAPVLLFFGSIGYVSWFHLGMLWTVMCIAAAALIGGGIERASAGRWGPRGQYNNALLLAAVFAAAALGLSTSGVLVHWDATSVYTDALAFTLQNYADSDAGIIMQLLRESRLIHTHILAHSDMDIYDFFTAQPQKTKKIVMIDSVDRIGWKRIVLEAYHGGGNVTSSPEADWSQRYLELYDGGSRVAEFHSIPKPDTPIPVKVYTRVNHWMFSYDIPFQSTPIVSKIYPRVDRTVEVTEWRPPGWASLPTYGPVGRALHLDGTAYVELADAPGLDLGGGDPFSIAFWIKMPRPDSPDAPIISKADTTKQQGIIVWGGHAGGISLQMADDAQGRITVDTFSSVADGRWHHVVFTYDGSRSSDGLDVYVDGQIDNRRRISTSLAGSVANDHPLVVGAGSTGKWSAQDIVLDDVMIYSARLPASYISDVHECHVEMAAGSVGNHACMGVYDMALLVHLEFEGDLSDSSGGDTAHGDARYAILTSKDP